MATPSPDPHRRIGIPHLPALDGLRGIAVVGVLFFHAGHLKGGYLGVDLFFVLSGYLITSLLLAEWAATGRIALKAFWIRRARRLFPAILAILPAVALYAAFLAKPGELARIRGDGLATLAYVANWRAILAGKSYWELFNAPSPLEHTWSLAIEEQFYVVWPFLVLVVFRLSRGSSRALLAVSTALTLLSAAAMWRLFTPVNTSRAYLGTDARGGSILAGAALACFLAERGTFKSELKVRALDAMGLASIVLLGVAWVRLGGQDPRLYRGGFWLTEVAVLVLIVCAAHGDRSIVARLFSFRPLTWIGLISYGVYLWHWPIFMVLTKARLGIGGPPLTAIRFAATLAISLISYRVLEQPIRKRGITFGKPIIVVPASAGLAVLAIVLSTRGARRVKVPALDALPQVPIAESVTKVLVFGDSVAGSLGERLRFVQGPRAFVIVRAQGDCSILHDQHNVISLSNTKHFGGDCDAKWASDAAEVRPDVTLILLGGGFFAPVEIGNRWRRACDTTWRKAFRDELSRNLLALAPNGGRRLLTLVPNPVLGWADATPKHKIDCYNDTLREAAAAAPGVELLDLHGHLCPNGDCVMESRGEPIRPDGMHFAGLGAEDTARWVLGKLVP